ncbi:ribose 5-phosphate isomerase B [Sphingobacteriales bacterium CHB3]|nr:ribose 5-phosphate isomerase B [Sphingobacteriales bacterium CHB3]
MNAPKGAIITPLAAELALAKGIEFSFSGQSAKLPETAHAASGSSPSKGAIVAFGSDHGGFQLKEQLKKYAEGLGYKVLDVGTSNEEPCDYPDFAYAVAKSVSTGEAWRGVMIDGAGIGSCVVANKVPGVKAACCHNEFVARNAREHNDTNVLTLGSRVVGSEVCKEILKIWLETWFSGGRHKQRVEKIDEVEKRFLKRS